MKYSVKTKLIVFTLAIFAAAAAAFSFISYSSAKRTAEAVVRSFIDQSTASAAESLSGKIQAVAAVTDDLSDNDAALNRAVDEIRLRLLKIRNDSYVSEGVSFDIAYIDDLRSIDGVTDYSSNEAVKSAASGTPLMTAPYSSGGKTVVSYASMLTEPYYERKCVLICTAGADFFDDVFGGISLGKSCAAYVTDESGIIAGSASGKKSVYSAEAPLSARKGWTLHVEAVPAELMPDISSEIMAAAGLSAVLALIMCIIIAVVLGRTLSPIKSMAERISALAEGDFTSPVPEVSSRDESYEIACALNKTIAALNGCVKEITNSISSVAEGDISDGNSAYPGEFSMIYRALSDMKGSLRKMLVQIRKSTDSVISSAETLSEIPVGAARPKAAGMPSASAASVNGGGYDITEVFEGRPDIAEYADKAAEKLDETRQKLTEEREKLRALTCTIVDINRQTDDIEDIIEQIEDIAFRTNILALNAAVEAASAGEHGRSFAVVADEVRSLANQSSKSAKETSELIEKIVSIITGGTSLARETSLILAEAVSRADETAELMSGLKTAADEYTEAAKIAEETLSRLSAEPVEYTVPANTEKTGAIVTEANRIRSLAESFKTS